MITKFCSRARPPGPFPGTARARQEQTIFREKNMNPMELPIAVKINNSKLWIVQGITGMWKHRQNQGCLYFGNYDNIHQTTEPKFVMARHLGGNRHWAWACFERVEEEISYHPGIIHGRFYDPIIKRFHKTHEEAIEALSKLPLVPWLDGTCPSADFCK